MRAGALVEQVTFQRRVASGDGMGNVTGAWSDLSGCVRLPAQVRPLRQSEESISQGVRAVAVFEVHVRYSAALAGVGVGDRMLDSRSGAAYAVTGPPQNPDQRRKGLRILVEAGGADG
jgi:head-tail adaptor